MMCDVSSLQLCTEHSISMHDALTAGVTGVILRMRCTTCGSLALSAAVITVRPTAKHVCRYVKNNNNMQAHSFHDAFTCTCNIRTSMCVRERARASERKRCVHTFSYSTTLLLTCVINWCDRRRFISTWFRQQLAVMVVVVVMLATAPAATRQDLQRCQHRSALVHPLHVPTVRAPLATSTQIGPRTSTCHRSLTFATTQQTL